MKLHAAPERAKSVGMSPQQSAPALPLYERVEQLRIAKGWSKVQLAQRLGLNRGTIENWRIQPRSPQAATVREVATRLDIDYAEALELAGITVEEARPIGATKRKALGTAYETDQAMPITPRRESRITDEEIRTSGLKPETVEAILRMRRRIARQIAEQDEDAIQRDDRVLGVLHDEQDTA